jgi:hypothetical protein
MPHLKLDDLQAPAPGGHDYAGPRPRAARGGGRGGSQLELEVMLGRSVEAAIGVADVRYVALAMIGKSGSWRSSSRPACRRPRFSPSATGRMAGPAGRADPQPPAAAAGGYRRSPQIIRLPRRSSAYELVPGRAGADPRRGLREHLSHAESRRGQRWLQASAEVTRRLLSGADPGEVLDLVTRQVLETSGGGPGRGHLPENGRRELVIRHAAGPDAGSTAASRCPRSRCQLRCSRREVGVSRGILPGRAGHPGG